MADKKGNGRITNAIIATKVDALLDESKKMRGEVSELTTQFASLKATFKGRCELVDARILALDQKIDDVEGDCERDVDALRKRSNWLDLGTGITAVLAGVFNFLFPGRG